MPNSITRWEVIIELVNGEQHCWSLSSAVMSILDATVYAKDMLYKFERETGISTAEIRSITVLDLNSMESTEDRK